MSKLIIERGFSQVPNHLNNSNQISLRAKGLYSYLNGKPDNWEFASYRIAKELKEGITCIHSCLKELERHGYLVRKPYQNEKGHWKRNYILKLFPENKTNTDLKDHPNKIPSTGNPTKEIPSIGNPTKENPTQGFQPNKKDINKKDINEKKRERGARSDFSKSGKEKREFSSENTSKADVKKAGRNQNKEKKTGPDKTSTHENKNSPTAFDFIKQQSPKEFERKFKSKYSGKIRNKEEFVDRFNDKMIIEGLRFDADKLLARLCIYAGSWVSNQPKYDLQPQSQINSSSKIPTV